MQETPTLPPAVAATATAIAATATAVTGTQVALQSTQVALTSTAIAGTSTAVAGVPTATVQVSTVSDIPVDGSGCMGDEQMWFIPRRPNIGTHVEIAVTSRRHHDVRITRLVGPLDSGTPTERLGPLGFVWTWTVVPSVEAFHQWTFYADGLRPCITSGFNAFAPLGATATPTETAIPTNTPSTTATPTPPPPPTISSIAPTHGNCGALVTITGSGFGQPPSSRGTTAFLTGSEGSIQMTPLGGSDRQFSVTVPTRGVNPGAHGLVVINDGGSSNQLAFSVDGAGCP
jgi:hypothetical protein